MVHVIKLKQSKTCMLTYKQQMEKKSASSHNPLAVHNLEKLNSFYFKKKSTPESCQWIPKQNSRLDEKLKFALKTAIEKWSPNYIDITYTLIHLYTYIKLELAETKLRRLFRATRIKTKQNRKLRRSRSRMRKRRGGGGRRRTTIIIKYTAAWPNTRK